MIGVIVSHISHLLSVLILYQLSLNIQSSTASPTASKFASLSAVLHIISPASLFLSAPYAESSFALLNFTGFYLYLQSRRSHLLEENPRSNVLMLLCGFVFGIATMFRGNGLFSGLVFVYDALEIVYHSAQMYCTAEKGLELVKIAHRLIIIGFAGCLMACIAVIPQYIAYSEFCVWTAPNSSKRSWCDAAIPSIYAWVQKQYW